ncbi:MAG: dihydropteroate synthase [Rhodospirillales bacterium]|nr:dihydropteroate synthase [Rhodospirillales bacterium]
MRLIEPLGLLDGASAAAAISAGNALPLAGGPLAFSLVRLLPDLRPAPVAEVSPDWLEALQRLSRPPGGAARGGARGPNGWASQPSVMGVLNVTPDSFSDGGDHLDPARAVAAGLAMAAAGAAIVDVGGESTRPGAAPTPPAIEQARILPVIRELARQGVRVSVDTRNASTMQAALDAGATMVNDISALTHDPGAASLLARVGVPVVLMHMRGDPATMAAHAAYQDVALEVTAELASRLAAAEAAGIARVQIALDPGIGFAKTGEHNLVLLSRLPLLLNLGCPLVVGVSRKRFLGLLGDEADPRRRLAGSLAAALYALARGASMLRVHDVAETVQALRVWQALAGAPASTVSLALAAG